MSDSHYTLQKQKLWEKYDHTFLAVFGLGYFNSGLKFMYLLAKQDLFKNYYQL